MKRALGAVVLLALACGGGGRPPPATPIANRPTPETPSSTTAPPARATKSSASPGALSDRQLHAMLEQMVAMFEAMGQVIDTHHGHCPELGRALIEIFDRNQPLLARGKQLSDDPAVRPRLDAWMSANMSRLTNVAQKLGAEAQACSSDPAFQEFLRRLQTLS